uniref:NEDD4 binding protein 2-like 2 n=1 Tax=Astyanax mexicanus TaxID=7994 RepID=W5KW86_ASTMX
MPHVTPVKSSSTPLGGNVEEGSQHPQTQNPGQSAPEIQRMHTPHAVTYRNNSVGNANRTRPLPYPVLLGQLNMLDSANVVEVNQNLLELPAQILKDNICEEEISGVDAEERSYERSREEVIKEIAVSSTAFIGPACRPDAAIEKELSDFYKELEEFDHHDKVDGVDGELVVTEGLSWLCEPETNPSPRKETRENDHKSPYRPYPATRPQRDYENSRTWKPQPHNEMTWNGPDAANSHPSQWQHLPPPRLPHDPPRFPIPGPRHFLPPPPPIPQTPTPPLHLLPPINNYSHHDTNSWCSWERTNFPLRNDIRLSASNCPESFEQRGRGSADWQPYYKTQHYHERDQYQRNSGTSPVLILMRGLPGCGKSTLAKEILSCGPDGLILSTDDYFFQEDSYFFDPTLLGNAHDWNQKRARDAMLDRRSPVIIDNTNVQAWEMKPYVTLALECGYRVDFVEPDTRWKCDPTELEKRNTHRVPRDTIAKMLDRFELPISVDIVMNSCEPPHKSKERLSKPYGQRKYDNF